MSKQWFIFYRDRHLGPFTKEEVQGRLRSGKISLETRVWRQGMAEWIALEHCQEFFPSEAVEELPPLPEISVPVAEQDPVVAPEVVVVEEISTPELPIATEVKEEKVPELSQDEELPPLPIPPEEVEEDIKEQVEEEPLVTPAQSETDIEEEEELANASVPPLKIKRGLLYWKIFLSLIPLAVVVLWVSLLTVERPLSLPLGAVTSEQANKLSLVSEDPSEEARLDMVLSRDQKKIFLVSNFEGPADVYLTLSSYNGKILSNSSSVLTAMATMENHLATFSDLRIEEGEGLLPGLYMAQVRGVKTSAHIRFFKYIRQLSFLKNFQFFKKLDDRFNYRGELLLGAASLEELDQKLKGFKAMQQKEHAKPLTELIERYRTYGAIVQMLNQLFRTSLQRFNEPGAVHLFENDYFNKIAPLYQSITVENKKIQVSLIESDEELSQEYQKLVEFGQQIGQLVVDINEKLKKYRKLKKKNRLELLVLFQGKLNELEELGKMRVHRLQESLANF